MAVALTRQTGKKRGWEAQHYNNVLVMNIVFVVVDTLMAAIMGSWFVYSVVYHDNTLDRLGMTVLPLFCPLSLLLPACCVWMWVAFSRLEVKTWLRVVPPAVLTALIAVYAAGAAYVAWLIGAPYTTSVV